MALFKKKFIAVLCLLLFPFFLSGDESKKVCLNMIVKNETKALEKCLNSVKPLITYWVIVDTGSTDGTQDLIRRVMEGIPGELYERPWKNFAHNRNEALDLARDKGDYILLIDADEHLVFADTFNRPAFDKDFYFAVVRDMGTLDYLRPLLIRSDAHWKWEGSLHESLVHPYAKKSEVLAGVLNVSNTKDGGRSLDPEKYKKDAAVMLQEIEKDPKNPRNYFYLAQSYGNAKEYQLALEAYQKRASMGGWDQEVFWSLYCVAKLHEFLKADADVIVQSYSKAYQSRPSRAEPLFRLAEHYLKAGNFTLAYAVAKMGLEVPKSEDIVFVESWVYDFGLLAAYAFSAHQLGFYDEASKTYQKLLQNKQLTEDLRKKIVSQLLDPRLHSVKKK